MVAVIRRRGESSKSGLGEKVQMEAGTACVVVGGWRLVGANEGWHQHLLIEMA